ncbi:hypothetical protein B0H14DRAFT_2611526 [Mycena olivaceomarginata]|nr:hypothetical protein B0H14DRAFT_2611526 [Mycena olivaceomarginata]
MQRALLRAWGAGKGSEGESARCCRVQCGCAARGTGAGRGRTISECGCPGGSALRAQAVHAESEASEGRSAYRRGGECGRQGQPGVVVPGVVWMSRPRHRRTLHIHERSRGAGAWALWLRQAEAHSECARQGLRSAAAALYQHDQLGTAREKQECRGSAHRARRHGILVHPGLAAAWRDKFLSLSLTTSTAFDRIDGDGESV